MKKKVKKGSFGYLKYQRYVAIMRTSAIFALSFLIFIVGYFYHKHDSQNILTVVAVLGCLPGCKSFVNVIMFLKAKECSIQAKEEIESVIGNLDGEYDLYFTSYEKNYPISHMVLKDKLLLGLTESNKCDCKQCEKHLITILNQEGHKDMTVKVLSDLNKYSEGLTTLNNKEQKNETITTEPDETVQDEKEQEYANPNQEIFSVLKSVSL